MALLYMMLIHQKCDFTECVPGRLIFLQEKLNPKAPDSPGRRCDVPAELSKLGIETALCSREGSIEGVDAIVTRAADLMMQNLDLDDDEKSKLRDVIVREIRSNGWFNEAYVAAATAYGEGEMQMPSSNGDGSHLFAAYVLPHMPMGLKTEVAGIIGYFTAAKLLFS